jgi:aminoglycoside phosphotransferase (APT) family kinase protein
MRLPRLFFDASRTVPRLLASLQVELHALDPAPLRRALAEEGLSERPLTPEGRLDDLEERVRSAALDGLLPVLAWLRRNAPGCARPVLCHGDLVFPNVCVDGKEISGVLDWSDAAIAHPAYDVAGTMARLSSPVVGVPRALGWLFEAAQRRMCAAYLDAYRPRSGVDGDALRYFEAFFLTSELVWSGEHLSHDRRLTGAIEERWLHPEAISIGRARLRVLTGFDGSRARARGFRVRKGG